MTENKKNLYKILCFAFCILFVILAIFINNDSIKVQENAHNAKVVEKDNNSTEEQAVEKTKEYLSLLAYSRSKLVAKLELDGFNKDEIDYAIKTLNINWKEQAVLKAEDYLRIGEFSREKLEEQLIYEGFTKEQVNYAIDAVEIK